MMIDISSDSIDEHMNMAITSWVGMHSVPHSFRLLDQQVLEV